MRDSTNTIRRTHIRMHSARGAREWAEKVFNSEKTVDAALGVLATMLSGWLVYCLAKALERCTYLI